MPAAAAAPAREEPAAAADAAAAAAANRAATAAEDVPVTTGKPLQIFQDLQERFKFSPKVTKFLLDTLELETLEDFVHLFTSEAEVGEMVTHQIHNLHARPLQTARLRQAWVGVKGAQAQELLVKKRAAEPDDLDELLPQPELEELSLRFWARYHVRYAPAVEPSDLLVSRLTKELGKRMLTVRCVRQTPRRGA